MTVLILNQEVLKEKDISSPLFGPINLGIELLLKDREKFLKYEIGLIANLEDLKKTNSGGKLNFTCQQICEKMLADIYILKLDFCKLETGLGEIGNLGSNAAGV